MEEKQPRASPLEKQEAKRLRKLVIFEKLAYEKGYSRVAGIDEVGRGPLAGPVVACACIIEQGVFFEGINDSKQLTPLKRKSLFCQLKEHPSVTFGIGIVDSLIIDRINILQATLCAMKEAIGKLPVAPDYLLVDGKLPLFFDSLPCEKIVQGDARSQSIAAASILAKETRDAIMVDYHAIYPQYHFDQHKGYGTELHIEALQIHGPCPIHRLTFAPVKMADKEKDELKE